MGYQFTDTTAATDAACRMAIDNLTRRGRMPLGTTFETAHPHVQHAVKADVDALLGVVAPVIAYDVFMEIRSALQRVVWAPDADPLTDEQTELWEQITETLAGLNKRITEGKP